MDTDIVFRPEAVRICGHLDNPAVLRELAELYARVYALDAKLVETGMIEREKLGSTGFGRAVAIPHCRSTGVDAPTLAVLKLAHPVDFDAADAAPVSLLFGLVSPEDAGARHLHALAAISRFTREEAMLAMLMEAPDADALYAILTDQFLRHAA